MFLLLVSRDFCRIIGDLAHFWGSFMTFGKFSFIPDCLNNCWVHDSKLSHVVDGVWSGVVYRL